MRGHKHLSFYDVEREEYVCSKCGEVLPPPLPERIKPSPLERDKWTGTVYKPEERAFLQLIRKKQHNLNNNNVKTLYCKRCKEKTKHMILDNVDEFVFVQCSKCGRRIELGLEANQVSL